MSATMLSDTSPVSPEELATFREIAAKMGKFLKILMKCNPLLRSEWETADLSQELALKYFKNLADIAADLKEGDHRLHLLRRMAKQLVVDKLRTIQRKKRDVRKELPNQNLNKIKYKYTSPKNIMVFQERIDAIRRKADDTLWKVIEWRSQGKSWEDCAQELNYKGSASALRVRVKRHVDSIKQVTES